MFLFWFKCVHKRNNNQWFAFHVSFYNEVKIQPGRALYVNDEFISDFSWSIFIQKSGSKTSKIRNHIHYLLFPISFLSQYSNLQCQLRAWLLSSTIRFKWISRNVRWWRKIANFCFHSRIWIDAVGLTNLDSHRVFDEKFATLDVNQSVSDVAVSKKVSTEYSS